MFSKMSELQLNQVILSITGNKLDIHDTDT